MPFPLRYKCQVFEDKISIDLTDETEKIEGWEDPYKSFILSVQVKGYLPTTYLGSFTDDFIAYGLVVPYGAFDLRNAVTKANNFHPVTPYDLPDLADLTINTKSFKVRRARIGNIQ